MSRALHREIVDLSWQAATDGAEVPSTSTADRIIAEAKAAHPPWWKRVWREFTREETAQEWEDRQW